MAAHIPTTPAPAGANAPAHPLAERRAAPVPLEGTPNRRSSRRRFLVEAGATIAAGLGVTAAVLTPDPSWSTPASAAPDADAELIRLCAAETANSQRFLALSEETADLVGPQPLEVAREYRLLVDRTNEAREVISAMPAATLAGVRAKAEAYRADWFDPVYGDDEDAIAQSLIDDLLRLLPAGDRA